MRIEHVIIKSGPGRGAFLAVKALDLWVGRLATARVEGKIPVGQFLPLTVGLGDMCDEAAQMLEKSIATFTLRKDDERNIPYFRKIMKRSGEGKRLRVKLQTSIGQKVYELFRTLDTLCCLVTMLVVDGRLSEKEGKCFFDVANEIVRKLNEACQQISKVVANVV